ncbi:MAG: GTPase domain-containing protein [Candidatus Lokiarchaeota archaeon]|nr:GTPase domain-containing protein [Candidatus Lokiarchaeota archaeon]
MAMKKVVFVGPANSGKTSLRKFFFEGVPADKILAEPEAPTVGVKYNRYNYVYSYPVEKEGTAPEKIPIELAMVDTSGQELEKFLTTPAGDNVFKAADIVLFIIDASGWDDEMQREYLMDFICFTNTARLQLAPQSVFHVVAHKYDLVVSGGKAGMDKLRARIKNDLQDYIFKKTRKFLDFNVHVTSLKKEYRLDTFQEILDLTTTLLSIPF